MKTILPFLSLLLLPVLSRAQTCDCPAQFDWLRKKLAINYSGYRDKVKPERLADFEQHNAGFQAKIAQVQSDTACLRLLAEWARWFHDGHIQLYASNTTPAESPVAIRQRYAGWERIALSEKEARRYFDRPDLDPVEGIYQNAEGNYRVAVMRNSTPERDFAAVLLKADSVWWLPGQVKFDLKISGSAHADGLYSARYYMRDHSQRNPTVHFASGKLHFLELGEWYKQYPGPPNIIPKKQVFTLETLDAVTLLLTLPTMSESVRLQLDSLIKANAALLEGTPNLIIDCRGNGGGSDITYYPLTPYVYSGPVRDHRTQIYATDDNIQKYERLQHDKNFPTLYRLYFGQMARKMRRKKGEFIGKCGVAKEKAKKLKANPQRVAILIDGLCASSCEQFVFMAEQSKRVTLIGQNTAGILDYGNLNTLTFPCGTFELAYPTSRSCRVDAGKGIDGKGIAPDVKIDADEKDWVEYARQYLKAPRK
jgi:hypothetical protein